MTYTITREDPERDLNALRAAIEKFRYPDEVEAVQLQHVQELADSIEEQVKPIVKDPEAFGSIVRAGYDEHTDRVLWVRTPRGWYAETDHGYHAYFAGLHEPEVLRVGIGEPGAKSKEALAAYDQGYGNGQYAGFSQALEAADEKLRQFRAEAITSERKSAYDTAIAVIEGLQP
jgi:hypothetical protein